MKAWLKVELISILIAVVAALIILFSFLDLQYTDQLNWTFGFHDTYLIINLPIPTLAIALILYNLWCFIRILAGKTNRYVSVLCILSASCLFISTIFLITDFALLFFSSPQKSGWTVYPPLSALPQIDDRSMESTLTANLFGKVAFGYLLLLFLEIVAIAMFKLRMIGKKNNLDENG